MTTAIEGALANLGVDENSLSPVEKAALDENGFLTLKGLLSPELSAALRDRFDQLVKEEGSAAGKEVHQEEGTHRLSDLVNKDPRFDTGFTHPRVLAAVFHVLRRDFKLSSLNARAALPGSGHQALHVDFDRAVAPGDYHVCNSIWLLDDFNEENGATRFVPGSHRFRVVPEKGMPDARATHPDEAKIVAPAGSVVIFNAHLWHGGTVNRTASPRRAFHSYFCRREATAQLDQMRYLRPHTFRRLTPAARYLLDVTMPDENCDRQLESCQPCA